MAVVTRVQVLEAQIHLLLFGVADDIFPAFDTVFDSLPIGNARLAHTGERNYIFTLVFDCKIDSVPQARHAVFVIVGVEWTASKCMATDQGNLESEVSGGGIGLVWDPFDRFKPDFPAVFGEFL